MAPLALPWLCLCPAVMFSENSGYYRQDTNTSVRSSALQRIIAYIGHMISRCEISVSYVHAETSGTFSLLRYVQPHRVLFLPVLGSI